MRSWNITSGGTLLVVSEDGVRHQTTKQNPRWDKILQAIRNDDEAEVIRLIDLKDGLIDFMEGNIMVKGQDIFFGNRPLFGLDVQRIFEFARQELPIRPMLRFLNNKMRNPSWRSIEELYGFLDQKGMPINERGNVIGYKGVQGDYWSISGNPQTVVLQGKTNEQGQILNEIGATIEIARNSACDDHQQCCASGLHVGSYEYAKSWAGCSRQGGGRLLEVEFNPADAVSVPSSEKTDKLRVCKYIVRRDCEGLLDNTYYVETEPETDDDSYEAELEREDAECQADYDSGLERGTSDGKGHKARLFTRLDEESGRDEYSDEYIIGYNDGYEEERRRQRNRSDCLQ